ncbi:MAG TPA: GGDEF domain-containing protein [Pseudorhizobium sp.]|nr:GGDEF domain-containing protein [Pseudorhizobium sp.]
MNGTNFILGMNFVIALAFCVVFFAVSTRSRSTNAVRWMEAGFAVAAVSRIFELAVAHTQWVQSSAVGSFATALGGLVLLRIGISYLYGERIRLINQTLFVLFWVTVYLFIYDAPRDTALHAVSYQAPFAILAFSGVRTVLQSTRRLPIDITLAGLLFLTGLHFVSKAYLAVTLGAGVTAKDFVHTSYAIISQSAAGIMIVTVGLTLLAMLVLEIMAEERSKSETDPLSGLLNRRGFEKQSIKLVERNPMERHALIMCDLDHFKSINDTHGHHFGDRVIETFGKLLAKNAPDNAIVARLGGEEFAVFLPWTTVEAAVSFAAALRTAISSHTFAGLPPGFRATSSFGVSAWSSKVTLQQNLQQADLALYEAKRAGRDCVKCATSERPEMFAAAQ